MCGIKEKNLEIQQSLLNFERREMDSESRKTVREAIVQFEHFNKLELPKTSIQGTFSIVATHDMTHLSIHMMGGPNLETITFLIPKTPHTVEATKETIIINL